MFSGEETVNISNSAVVASGQARNTHVGTLKEGLTATFEPVPLEMRRSRKSQFETVSSSSLGMSQILVRVSYKRKSLSQQPKVELFGGSDWKLLIYKKGKLASFRRATTLVPPFTFKIALRNTYI